MAAKISKNNVIAGLFVVAAMVLAVAMSVVVSGATKRLASTNAYTIHFTLADGASGLKVDSPVTLGGQEVGRVTQISFDRPGGGGGTIKGVNIRVAIRSEITLHTDAWAFLEKPLLGSMSAINFSYVGGEPDPSKGGAVAGVLQPGAVLNGSIAPPSFLAQAGYGPDQISQVKRMIAEASEAIDKVDHIAEKIEKDLDPSMKGIEQAIADVNTITSEWRAKSPQWTGKIDSTLANVDSASGGLSGLEDQAKSVLADANAAVKRFQEIIDENREPIKRAVANIDSAVDRFKTETMPLADDMIKSAKAGADEFRDANGRLQTLIKQEEPNIQRILANFRLASDQIKLAGIEIRRSPWRLLYTPKTKELESELFYDAARTYAEAVSDLRATSEALESTSAGPNPESPSDRETLEHIKARLDEAFKKYQDAEKDLLKKMTEK